MAASCAHSPLVHKPSWRRLIETVREVQPEVFVFLGDGLEASPASKHPNEDNWTLTDEFTDWAKHLKELREACPGGAKLVWTLGNHDDNIRQIGRLDKRIRDMCDWNCHAVLGPEAAFWHQVPYSHRQTWRLGPVIFRHGSEAGVNADRNQAVLYGVENGLVVGGHTHAGLDVTEAKLTSRIPLKKYFANAGCLVDWNRLGYMERKNFATWTHSCLVGDVSRTSVRDNRSRFANKQWDAKLVVFERGDD